MADRKPPHAGRALHDVFHPQPTVVLIPKRDGRLLVRDSGGELVMLPVEVYDFADLPVDDSVRVLALEDGIIAAGDVAEQLRLGQEVVRLVCPGLDADTVNGMSPGIVREVRRIAFESVARPAPAEPAQEAARSNGRPRVAGSASSSERSPEPAVSSASPPVASGA